MCAWPGRTYSEVDSNDVAPTGAPDELMSKPRWQRALISFAGPAVNLIMPILLAGRVFCDKGPSYPAYLDKPIVLSGLPQTSPLAKAGPRMAIKSFQSMTFRPPTWSKANSYLVQAAQDGMLR